MIFTIITFLIVLSLVVLVHEIGHYVAAKKAGVKVEEFGFGYPPRIFALKKGPTEYSINWIPFGGFVKLKGLGNRDDKSENSFNSKKIWQRSAILSAGVFMNVFLAFVLISLGFTIGMPSAISETEEGINIRDKKIQVYEVMVDSPASQANIEPGDIVVSINDQVFEKSEEIQAYNAEKVGEEIILKIKRGDEIIDKNITLSVVDDTGKGKLGVSLVETGLVSFPIHLAIWNGLKSTFFLVYQIMLGFYNLIKDAIVTQQISADISGPVGIAVISGQMARMGFIYIVQFIAILSLTLALINFLPFPALDGGHILFLIIEKIKGSPINSKIENAMHTVGFYLILLLFVYISFRDIIKFNIAANVINFFKNIF